MIRILLTREILHETNADAPIVNPFFLEDEIRASVVDGAYGTRKK